MKNKIYFVHDIFPVFFLVFFLYVILWTNCDKIIFTQIPKALSVLVLEKKNKECFGKPDKFGNFSLAVFLNSDFVFSQVLPEVTINKNSNFIQFPLLSPPNCGKTKSNLKKRARGNFLNLSGFLKHSLLFPRMKTEKALGNLLGSKRDFYPHFRRAKKLIYRKVFMLSLPKCI